MTTYYKVTEKELLALINVSESANSTAEGADNEGFIRETQLGDKAIKSILKRAGKKTKWIKETDNFSIPNVVEIL